MSHQLRAVQQGRRDEALATLGSVFDWFTEGRENNADLREAAALLKALRDRNPLSA